MSTPNLKSFIHLPNSEDWIPLEEARKLLKNGRGIQKKSMLNRVYKNNFPDGAVAKSLRGNYFFNKNKLIGLE